MALKLSDLDTSQYQFTDKKQAKKSSGILGTAKNLAIGGAKSAGELALGIGQIGRKIQNAAGLNLGNKLSSVDAQGSVFDNERAENIRNTTLKPEGGAQKVGKFVGDAAQYLVPTSKIAKGQRILGAAASKVPTKLGRGVAGASARFVPEAIGTGAVAATRSGGDLEQAKTEALFAGGASVGLGAIGSMARSSYWPDLSSSVSKALGSQGKKSAGVALKDTAQQISGLQVLKQRAPKLSVTLDDGSKGIFDPKEASYSTTLQAWKEARNQVFEEYSSLSAKAGEKATVNLKEVRDMIEAGLDAPVLDIEKNAVRSILQSFDNVFDDVGNVDIKKAERFVKSLNENTVQGLYTGTSDAASSKVNAGTARLIRDVLDDAIEEATGSQYQALRSDYAALKSLENDLVRKFQQNMRSIGGGLAEYTGAFASGDLVGSALSLDPAQFAKGATVGAFALLKRRLSNPERFLRRSFDLVDNAPSNLSQRIWGGSAALTASEQKAASAVADSVANPAVGMSIRKSVSPASVARKADRADIRLLARVIDDPSLAKTNPAVRRVLSDMGLANATEDELVRFAKEVIDESEGVATRTVNAGA